MKPHRNDCRTCLYFAKDNAKSESYYGFCTWLMTHKHPHWIRKAGVDVYSEDHAGCDTWKYGPLPLIQVRRKA